MDTEAFGYKKLRIWELARVRVIGIHQKPWISLSVVWNSTPTKISRSANLFLFYPLSTIPYLSHP